MVSVLHPVARRTLLGASLLLLLCTSARPHSEPGDSRPEASVPAWFIEHLETHMQDGGRWIADNHAYVSDSEPIDAYGIEWRWGAGRRSLQGRMFAIAGGRETATVSELRMLWHPGEQRALVYEYGSDGTLGVGVLESAGEGRFHLDQTLHELDGSTRSVRFEEGLEPDGARVSTSFVETTSGWKAERTYVWVVQVS